MPADTFTVSPDARVNLLRLAVLDILDRCTEFAAEVEEAEADCGCMSVLVIQQHLEYLRQRANELRGPVQ